MTFGNTAPKQLSDGNSQGTVLGQGPGNLQWDGIPDKISFFGANPVLQQTALGTTTGFTAASGTAVLSGSTFTGGTGTSAYTIGDLVLAMKNYGLIAA